MALEDLWPALEALRRRLQQETASAIGVVAEPLGLNAPGWALLLRTAAAAPEPLSAARLGGWNPYVNPWTYEAGLQHLAAVGLLAAETDGAYALTPAGQAAVRRLLAALSDRLGQLQPLDAPARERLAGLLQRVAAACLTAPEPPRRTRLRLSRWMAGEGEARAMVRLDQALADLAAYREDCHVAAWQPHMVGGPAWDTLSALWRGTPGTLEALYGQMVRRGWPRDTYARALQALARADWVAGPEPYTLTPKGRAVREQAEAQTQRDFFAPWRVLEAEALAALRSLLAAMTTAPLGEPAPASASL